MFRVSAVFGNHEMRARCERDRLPGRTQARSRSWSSDGKGAWEQEVVVREPHPRPRDVFPEIEVQRLGTPRRSATPITDQAGARTCNQAWTCGLPRK